MTTTETTENAQSRPDPDDGVLPPLSRDDDETSLEDKHQEEEKPVEVQNDATFIEMNDYENGSKGESEHESTTAASSFDDGFAVLVESTEFDQDSTTEQSDAGSDEAVDSTDDQLTVLNNVQKETPEEESSKPKESADEDAQETVEPTPTDESNMLEKNVIENCDQEEAKPDVSLSESVDTDCPNTGTEPTIITECIECTESTKDERHEVHESEEKEQDESKESTPYDGVFHQDSIPPMENAHDDDAPETVEPTPTDEADKLEKDVIEEKSNQEEAIPAVSLSKSVDTDSPNADAEPAIIATESIDCTGSKKDRSPQDGRNEVHKSEEKEQDENKESTPYDGVFHQDSIPPMESADDHTAETVEPTPTDESNKLEKNVIEEKSNQEEAEPAVSLSESVDTDFLNTDIEPAVVSEPTDHVEQTKDCSPQGGRHEVRKSEEKEQDEDEESTPTMSVSVPPEEFSGDLFGKIASFLGDDPVPRVSVSLHRNDIDIPIVINKKEFYKSLELALDQTNKDKEEHKDDEIASTSIPVSDEGDVQWSYVVEAMTALAQGKQEELIDDNFYDALHESISKSTSALEETMEEIAQNGDLMLSRTFSQDMQDKSDAVLEENDVYQSLKEDLDEISASLEDDRQQIANRLKAWSDSTVAARSVARDETNGDGSTVQPSVLLESSNNDQKVQIEDSTQESTKDFLKVVADVCDEDVDEIRASLEEDCQRIQNFFRKLLSLVITFLDSWSEACAASKGNHESSTALADEAEPKHDLTLTVQDTTSSVHTEQRLVTEREAVSVSSPATGKTPSSKKDSRQEYANFKSSFLMAVASSFAAMDREYGEIAASLDDDRKALEVLLHDLVAHVIKLIEAFNATTSTAETGAEDAIESNVEPEVNSERNVQADVTQESSSGSIADDLMNLHEMIAKILNHDFSKTGALLEENLHAIQRLLEVKPTEAPSNDGKEESVDDETDRRTKGLSSSGENVVESTSKDSDPVENPGSSTFQYLFNEDMNEITASLEEDLLAIQRLLIIKKMDVDNDEERKEEKDNTHEVSDGNQDRCSPTSTESDGKRSIEEVSSNGDGDDAPTKASADEIEAQTLVKPTPSKFKTEQGSGSGEVDSLVNEVADEIKAEVRSNGDDDDDDDAPTKHSANEIVEPTTIKSSPVGFETEQEDGFGVVKFLFNEDTDQIKASLKEDLHAIQRLLKIKGTEDAKQESQACDFSSGDKEEALPDSNVKNAETGIRSKAAGIDDVSSGNKEEELPASNVKSAETDIQSKTASVSVNDDSSGDKGKIIPASNAKDVESDVQSEASSVDEIMACRSDSDGAESTYDDIDMFRKNFELQDMIIECPSHDANPASGSKAVDVMTKNDVAEGSTKAAVEHEVVPSKSPENSVKAKTVQDSNQKVDSSPKCEHNGALGSGGMALPPRPEPRGGRSAKRRKVASTEDASNKTASECETTVATSAATSVATSRATSIVSEADDDSSIESVEVDASCMLGNVFDQFLDTILGSHQLCDESSLSSKGSDGKSTATKDETLPPPMPSLRDKSAANPKWKARPGLSGSSCSTLGTTDEDPVSSDEILKAPPRRPSPTRMVRFEAGKARRYARRVKRG